MVKPYPQTIAELRKTIDNIVKYNGRLPVKRIKHKNAMFAKLFVKLKIAAARSGAIGLSYALKICTINGDIPEMPVNSAKTKSDNTITSGFRVCIRFSSAHFSSSVGNGCVQI